jgi:hypothetical protein
MIKDLTKILGVTQEMGIRWELGAIGPSSQNLKTVEHGFAKLGSSRIRNQARSEFHKGVCILSVTHFESI